MSADPIRVGLAGAGFAASALARHLVRRCPDIELAAAANRDPERLDALLAELGVSPQRPSDPLDLAAIGSLDVVVDATRSIGFARDLGLAVLRAGQSFLTLNCEMDACWGPLLARTAAQHGAVYSNVDGDQPGVLARLNDEVLGWGMEPRLYGNIKGMLDITRTPESQRDFARQWGMDPAAAASFADGSKLAAECAVLANGVGARTAPGGMTGPAVPTGTPIEQVWQVFLPLLEQYDDPMVDYILGAEPGPGVFIIARETDPRQRHYLRYYKMGDGPYYLFVRPFHLCHMEVPRSIRQVVHQKKPVISSSPRPTTTVIAVTKRDLSATEKFDGIGGYTHYGKCRNLDEIQGRSILPQALLETGELRRPIVAGTPIETSDLINSELLSRETSLWRSCISAS